MDDSVCNSLDIGFFTADELRGFGFGSVGKDVKIAKNCLIVGPQNIHLGDHVRIDAFTSIVTTAGRLTFAGRNHIGGQSHLSVAADLHFGKFSGVSQGVRIYTSTDDYSGEWLTGPAVPTHLRSCRTAPIRIGRHVILGAGTVLLPGCDLEDGAAVGALSLVTKRLAGWSLYHGNPAKFIKRRSRRVLELESEILE